MPGTACNSAGESWFTVVDLATRSMPTCAASAGDRAQLTMEIRTAGISRMNERVGEDMFARTIPSTVGTFEYLHVSRLFIDYSGFVHL